MGPSKFHQRQGDFILDGSMTEDEVAYAINEYGVKGWLYLNAENPSLKSQVESAGVAWACIPVEPPHFTSELAGSLISTLDTLPRPTMIQCGASKRSSAVYALYATRDSGSASSFARALGLACSTDPSLMCWLGNQEVIFRQMFDAEHGSSTYTYLLADPITKEAVLIDPVMELVDRDLAIINDLNLNLVLGINTHCHADHITGTGELKKKVPNMKSGIAEASGAKADIMYNHGDIIKVGSIELEVRATPGHTNGCVSYYTKANGGMVFTGDALLIRGCGRTDFQQGNSEMLYKSVHEQIFTLPESTKVPGRWYLQGLCMKAKSQRHGHRIGACPPNGGQRGQRTEQNRMEQNRAEQNGLQETGNKH